MSLVFSRISITDFWRGKKTAQDYRRVFTKVTGFATTHRPTKTALLKYSQYGISEHYGFDSRETRADRERRSRRADLEPLSEQGEFFDHDPPAWQNLSRAEEILIKRRDWRARKRLLAYTSRRLRQERVTASEASMLENILTGPGGPG
jgi:hypothetical protein